MVPDLHSPGAPEVVEVARLPRPIGDPFPCVSFIDRQTTVAALPQDGGWLGRRVYLRRHARSPCLHHRGVAALRVEGVTPDGYVEGDAAPTRIVEGDLPDGDGDQAAGCPECRPLPVRWRFFRLCWISRGSKPPHIHKIRLTRGCLSTLSSHASHSSDIGCCPHCSTVATRKL